MKDRLKFLYYIRRRIEEPLLEFLIKQEEKNVPYKVKKKLKDVSNIKYRAEFPKEILFLYIVYNRKHKNSTLNELGIKLRDNMESFSYLSLSKPYKELQKILKLLDHQPLQVSKQVIRNIKYFFTNDESLHNNRRE